MLFPQSIKSVSLRYITNIPATTCRHHLVVEDDALDDDIASMSYGTMSESTIDDDFVMPIACCDDYDWEDNDTSYNLGNLFGNGFWIS